MARACGANRRHAEVLELIERRRKRADTERRWMVGEARMISVPRALAFVFSVFELVVRADVDERLAR